MEQLQLRVSNLWRDAAHAISLCQLSRHLYISNSSNLFFMSWADALHLMIIVVSQANAFDFHF